MAWGPAGGKIRTIHLAGETGSPTVVLLHELAGVTEPFLEFGDTVAGWGHRVLMPELFGRAASFNAIRLCVSREFMVFTSGRSSPVSDWIRSLCGSPLAGEGKVAVIGMCATGGLILSILYDPNVTAGVMAQPSLPLRFGNPPVLTKCELGSSAADLASSVESEKPVLALRFTEDGICPAARTERLEQEWLATGLFDLVEFEGRGHSTLVADACRAQHVERGSSHEVLQSFLAGVDWG